MKTSESIEMEPENASLRALVGVRWFAVHTQPHREFRANQQLENQGFQVFLPKRLKTIRHARKLTNVSAPFFPRYLFIQLDLSQHRWRSVNGSFGVSSLVMQGDLPHPVPHGVVEAMIASVDPAGLLCLSQHLSVGDRVRLAAGPFADKLGILDRLDDSGRVRVLLEIMGGTVRVQVERKFVTAA
jgi:transcriptional antiterminator RfaH